MLRHVGLVVCPDGGVKQAVKLVLSQWLLELPIMHVNAMSNDSCNNLQKRGCLVCGLGELHICSRAQKARNVGMFTFSTWKQYRDDYLAGSAERPPSKRLAIPLSARGRVFVGRRRQELSRMSLAPRQSPHRAWCREADERYPRRP